ncbi:hypothetical protein ACFSVM_25605 [Paenibacillus shunpengii]|uniref:Rho termination factor N-terminal domain-containing protein n=1 Tax=Paenibacillus shunpengii TaxID=2054424 RepID=A0ABW5SVM1_9BACL
MNKVQLTTNYRTHGKLLKKGEYVTIDDDQLKEYLRDKVIDEDLIEEVDDPAPKDVNDMTVPELKDYAKNNKIDLGVATKKDDILVVIKKAEEAQV